MNTEIHNITYIDTFFNGGLTATEKESFANRCISDPVFAEEVAFYIMVRSDLKREVYKEKKKGFEEIRVRLSSRKAPREAIIRKLFPYAAAVAACLLIVLLLPLFFDAPTAQQLANSYFKSELDTLSKTMGNGTDSMQMGISAYNNDDFDKAEAIFQRVSHNKTAAPEAVKYLGIVYLATGRYNEALEQFEKLSAYTLFANWGPFYKAITLMKRSAKGDCEEAEKLLREVTRNNMPGKEEAEKWKNICNH